MSDSTTTITTKLNHKSISLSFYLSHLELEIFSIKNLVIERTFYSLLCALPNLGSRYQRNRFRDLYVGQKVGTTNTGAADGVYDDVTGMSADAWPMVTATGVTTPTPVKKRQCTLTDDDEDEGDGCCNDWQPWQGAAASATAARAALVSLAAAGLC